MNRTEVDSSQIKSVGYDEATLMLEVEFRYSGSVYTYFDVPKSEYDAMMAAESVGKYFNANIKGSGYKYELQTAEPKTDEGVAQ